MSKAKLRAEAINRFVTDAKAQGVYSSLKAACILTGWDTLAGALTPLVGAAPTNVGGAFTAADYDRGGQGLKGDGSSKYLNSNRHNTDDSQDDQHLSVYATSVASDNGVYNWYAGAGTFVGATNIGRWQATEVRTRSRTSSSAALVNAATTAGFLGVSRASGSSYQSLCGGVSASTAYASETPHASYIHFFSTQGGSYSDPRMSWYSIGSSVDLAALDTLVTRLMADLRAIEEDGMDRDALSYIRAVEAADGSFMVTGVKNAIDRLVKGLKYDRDANGRSAWDAIGASCLLCGPRTIAGALVPLKGVAPTAYNFVSANYNQETGLVGVPAAGTYINTGRANNADPQDDNHNALYYSYVNAAAAKLEIGAGGSGSGANNFAQASGTLFIRSRTTYSVAVGSSGHTGLAGFSRSNGSQISYRVNGITSATSSASQLPSSDSVFVFARNNGSGTPEGYSDARLAFYSLGASLSLSALDARITKYVADVAAAIP